MAREGVCLPDTDAGAMPDAGTYDGAMPDAATYDGATPDAAVDTSVLDGSMSDGAASDACTTTTYYADTDLDGFGDPASSMDACESPAGFIADNADCDDSTMAVHPGAAEVCDAVVDDNCDGTVDEGCACSDGDTRACGTNVGACTQGTQSCAAGTWGACAGGIGPSMETCNGADDDCDGTVDNGDPGGGASCGSDVGACVAGTLTCTTGSLACAGEVTPVTEVCDGLDNDCDGMTDEGVKRTFHADCDGDSFGDAARTHAACTAADAAPFFGAGCGATTDATDCNDDCATCHPGATETCDSKDNDCDGMVDEGVRTSFYRDLDRDGFGAGAPVLACVTPGSGYVTDNTDCYDAGGSAAALAAQVHPGQFSYFGTGYPGPKPFDYNCDGLEDQRWQSIHTADECMDRDTPAAEGWVGSVPACGASGSYVTCFCVALGCTDNAPVARTQECR